MNTHPVVIVTGAARGVGAAVARWLGKKGAAVALVSRTESSLDQTAAQVKDLGGESLLIQADIADPNACRRIAEKTIHRFGRLDALVNNAGMMKSGTLARPA